MGAYAAGRCIALVPRTKIIPFVRLLDPIEVAITRLGSCHLAYRLPFVNGIGSLFNLPLCIYSLYYIYIFFITYYIKFSLLHMMLLDI